MIKKLFNYLRAIRLRRQLRKMNRLMGFKYFKRECKRADEMAEYTGKRYRVYLFDRYRALCGDDIQRMRNQRMLAKHDNTGILSKKVYYDTQMKANTHPEFSNRKL